MRPTRGVAAYNKFDVGPEIEMATPDIPLPGYAIVFPGLFEAGLFAKAKVVISGRVYFDYSPACGPLFKNANGVLTASGAIEGILKVEVTDVVKINAINVGGGVGASCPANGALVNCKGKFYVFAKSEVELANFKWGLIAFYQSTDASGSIGLGGFVD